MFYEKMVNTRPEGEGRKRVLKEGGGTKKYTRGYASNARSAGRSQHNKNPIIAEKGLGELSREMSTPRGFKTIISSLYRSFIREIPWVPGPRIGSKFL